MFWKKIAKIVLGVNVVFGFIASIAAGVSIGKMMEYVLDSGGGIGFLVFLLGIIITLVNCCVLGTICEIADRVNELDNGNVNNASGSFSAEKEIIERLISLEKYVKKLSQPGAFETVVEEKSEELSEPVKESVEIVYDNKVAESAAEEAIVDDKAMDSDKTVAFDNNDAVNLDATVASPQSVHDDIEVNKNENEVIEEKEVSKTDETAQINRVEQVLFCINCGTKNQIDSIFCYSCGTKLVK